MLFSKLLTVWNRKIPPNFCRMSWWHNSSLFILLNLTKLYFLRNLILKILPLGIWQNNLSQRFVEKSRRTANITGSYWSSNRQHDVLGYTGARAINLRPDRLPACLMGRPFTACILHEETGYSGRKMLREIKLKASDSKKLYVCPEQKRN